MNLEQIKYCSSPYDDEDGILLVDPEDESIPMTDANGDLQYYCPGSGRTFSLSEDDD